VSSLCGVLPPGSGSRPQHNTPTAIGVRPPRRPQGTDTLQYLRGPQGPHDGAVRGRSSTAHAETDRTDLDVPPRWRLTVGLVPTALGEIGDYSARIRGTVEQERVLTGLCSLGHVEDQRSAGGITGVDVDVLALV
jgi:hypothetical protein